MRVVFFIHTPGQVHLWSNIVDALQRRGHTVKVIARQSESVNQLLDYYGIQYTTYGKSSKTKYGKVLQLPFQLLRSFAPVNQFRPDILIGTSTMEAWISILLGKPSIIFDDSEPLPFLERLSWGYPASSIMSPACFIKDLGKKHVRFNGYKELAYLHPNRFKPDPTIYRELGITNQERFVILRFGSFEAVHDVGRKGLSTADKYQLVSKLRKHARVFISSEGTLPADLEQYKLPTSYHRIHHALYFADLVIGDTGTMSTEAAVLGTPTIICASFTSQFGNFIELEQKYGLLYCFQEADKALIKAIELTEQTDLKKQWAIKRKRMLADKTDTAKFIADFIENYPPLPSRNRKT